MNAAMLGIIVALIEEAIKLEPAIAAELKTLFAKKEITPADWMALRLKVLGQSFESLAPDAKTE